MLKGVYLLTTEAMDMAHGAMELNGIAAPSAVMQTINIHGDYGDIVVGKCHVGGVGLGTVAIHPHLQKEIKKTSSILLAIVAAELASNALAHGFKGRNAGLG